MLVSHSYSFATHDEYIVVDVVCRRQVVDQIIDFLGKDADFVDVCVGVEYERTAHAPVRVDPELDVLASHDDWVLCYCRLAHRLCEVCPIILGLDYQTTIISVWLGADLGALLVYCQIDLVILDCKHGC